MPFKVDVFEDIVFDVVKHFVLKLLPMQTTMTFELLLFDCVDCTLSVL